MALSKLKLLSLTLLLSAAGLFAPAHATPVSYSWTAQATVAQSTYGVKIGDLISGQVSYDPATATMGDGYGPGATSGYQYWNSPSMFTTLNYGSFHGNIALYAMVVNNYSMWGGDELFFRANTSAVGQFQIGMADPTMTAFDSLMLPTSAFDLSALPLYDTVNIGGQRTVATLTSYQQLAAATVPEPATLALVGLAMGGLLLARRRKK